MPESRLQHTEIPLYERPETAEGQRRGHVWIEPAGDPYRSVIQVQILDGDLNLHELTPEEAYVIGRSLMEHAEECGFDYNTGETTRPEG